MPDQFPTTHERVANALAVLAVGLEVPCDIISVHRRHSGKSRPKEFQSLRYGAFLLAVASLDAFFTTASGWGQNHPGQSLGIRPDRVRGAFDKYAGVPNVQRHWRARTRVASEKFGATYKRSPWLLLEGNELRSYLEDLHGARNVLAHGLDKSNFQNESGAFHPLKKGGFSIRLMSVEGVIQAIEDIASQTAIAVVGPEVDLPSWPEPSQTEHGTTGKIATPYEISTQPA
jgi:hypothetical protein